MYDCGGAEGAVNNKKKTRSKDEILHIINVRTPVFETNESTRLG